jgi:hypothetical protein
MQIPMFECGVCRFKCVDAPGDTCPACRAEAAALAPPELDYAACWDDQTGYAESRVDLLRDLPLQFPDHLGD